MIGALFLIVARSLRRHALSTAITVLSTALGCGLVMAVFAIGAQSREAFAGGNIGFDAILGARGSQVQLVLNTVFHLETSPGNLPWSVYEEIQGDARIEAAVPYAVGDNFHGYRIVGTTGAIFTELRGPEGQMLTCREGVPFAEDRREAVVGSRVASELGLRPGALIHPSHGLQHDEEHHDESLVHEEEYVVTGVLLPTNSPADRVIWIPIEGVFRMGGHVLRGSGEDFHPKPGEAIPAEAKEVSAVLLRFKGGNATGMHFDNLINRQGKEATLAWPIGKSIAELFEKFGWVTRILELVAYLVVAVAAGSILASLYNTMNERRREFAILRALGARRLTVFSAIVGEAGAIALLGALLGYGVYLALLAGAAALIRARTGVVLDLSAFHPALALAPVGMLALGMVAGILPALRAYATDVARNLLPTS